MADLGLDLYESVNEDGDCIFQYAELEEEKTIPSKYEDLELPPLPPEADNEFDTFPVGVNYKYAEDQDFAKLDTLPPLEKLFLCVSANAYPRRMWICHQIPILLSELTLEQAFAYVFPLTLRLCQDDILAVRESLIANLGPILDYFYEIPKFESKLKMDEESIIQLLGMTLFSSEAIISEQTMPILIEFLKKKDTKSLEQNYLPILINLLLYNHNFDVKQYIELSPHLVRVMVLNIIRELFPVCRMQTLIEVLLPCLENLIMDPSYEVRKELAINLKNLYPLLNSDVLINRIFPLYETLAQDEVYEVRLESLELLVHISETMVLSGYQNKMSNHFEMYLKDQSQKVQNKAIYLLGRFIYLFGNKEASDPLLKKFINNCKSFKSEVKIGCAYHFPAVVLTLGYKNWQWILASFQNLVKEKDELVVKPIASSMHELCKILNSEQVTKDIYPIFEKWLLEKDEEIQYLLLRNSVELYRKLDTEKRKQALRTILETFKSLLIPKDNYIKYWRQKQELINQLKQFIHLLSSESVIHILFPMLLEIVRVKHAKIVKDWILDLIPSVYEKVNLIQDKQAGLWVYFFDVLNDLITSKSYFHRLIYVLICQKIYENFSELEVLEQFFLPNLTRLVNDNQFEVRYAVVKLLSKVRIKDIKEKDTIRQQLILDLLSRIEIKKEEDIITNLLKGMNTLSI